MAERLSTLKYEIVANTNNNRILIVLANDLMRWALFDSNDTPLKFKRVGSKAVAITSGIIKVYRKPTGLQFHKAHMQHTGRSYWLGFKPKYEELINNMLEYEGTI